MNHSFPISEIRDSIGKINHNHGLSDYEYDIAEGRCTGILSPKNADSDSMNHKKTMPGLLRLNSEGEDTYADNIDYGGERCANHRISSTSNSHNQLHSSPSVDSIFSKYCHKSLLTSMITAKNLSPNKRAYSPRKMPPSSLSKSFSFSGTLSSSGNFDYGHSPAVTRQNLNFSFDSCQKNSPSKMCSPPYHNLSTSSALSGSMLNTHNNSFSSPEFCLNQVRESKSLGKLLMAAFMPSSTVAKGSMDTGYHSTQTSSATSVVTNTTQSCPSTLCAIPSLSSKCTFGVGRGGNDVSDGQTNNSKTANMNTCNFFLDSMPLFVPLCSTPRDSASCVSSRDVSLPSEDSCKKLHFSNINESMPIPLDLNRDNKASSADCLNVMKEQGEKLKMSESKFEENCTSKQSSDDVASVLFSPRRIVRKGRPSSKKKKKRQRERNKQVFHSSPVDESQESSQTSESESSDRLVLECSNEASKLRDESNCSARPISDSQHSPDTKSNPVKKQPNASMITCLFYTPQSDSEDGFESNGDDDDWSVEDNLGACISPVKGFGFNFALNIDSIFKKKTIPSLHSILSVADESISDRESHAVASNASNNLCLKVSVSFSDSDSSNSVEFHPTSSASLSSSDLTSDNEDSFSCVKFHISKTTRKNPDQLDFEGSTSLESFTQPLHHCLKEINSEWNRNYPTAGFRSCQSQCPDITQDPRIKIKFAAEPDLVTVHAVGCEDRGGIWHHYAADRERFERRIQDVGAVISPVLDPFHRAKIQTRNKSSMKMMD